ncbi:MAG: hypothetical protein D6803_06910, partial [Anaerolineae bacterium]
MSVPPSQEKQPEKKRRRLRVMLSPLTFFLMLAAIFLLGVMAWPVMRARLVFWQVDATPAPSATSSPTATARAVEITPAADVSDSDLAGAILFAMWEGLDTHLFVYRPFPAEGENALTRVTSGPGNDITPALSPDRRWLAYASNRSGEWQIYLWDLTSGQQQRLTSNPAFKASPTWSPDGLWLAYEMYFDNSLDIFIQSVEGGDPLRLTDSQAADYAPAWDPAGRRIAFVSTRAGREEIWLAELDKSGEDRFTPLPNPEQMRAYHPSWSPDGRYLAWGGVDRFGFHQVYVWDARLPEKPPRRLTSGDLPVWGGAGDAFFAFLDEPGQTYLLSYASADMQTLSLPPLALEDRVAGALWLPPALRNALGETPGPAPTPLWQGASAAQDAPGQRQGLVELPGVEAPYAELHNQVVASFNALRQAVSHQAGWDALGTLENAYVPLTIPLPPGYEQDWLYTGRAFAVSALPVHAGWMTVVREDYGPQTYWRLYLRARFQDGSQGMPLHALPWDFSARFQADPQSYEQGGQLAAGVPAGYWVDLTRLAELFGWQRLPARSNWRSVYSAARFNQFVQTGGLDWQTAMLELYPAQILITPTPIPTRTPTPTPSDTPTPSNTPPPSET